jgi:succinate dehydrogenase / fumarate reductase membrane anchor subunit
MSDKSMRSDLGRVRGMGSAKEGVHHWWMQRLTAIALIPLVLWFVASVAGLAGAGYEETAAWLSQPFVAIAVILMVTATLYHAVLGIQVVIEDYIHHEGWKFFWLIAMKFVFLVLGLVAVFSVLKLAL